MVVDNIPYPHQDQDWENYPVLKSGLGLGLGSSSVTLVAFMLT